MIALGLVFMFLPWLPGQTRNHFARWFPPGQHAVSLLALISFIAILAADGCGNDLSGAQLVARFLTAAALMLLAAAPALAGPARQLCQSCHPGHYVERGALYNLPPGQPGL